MRQLIYKHYKKCIALLTILAVLNLSIVLVHSFSSSISWRRWVSLWAIGGISDATAAFVAFGHAWASRNKNPFVVYYVMLLGAIFLETLFVLVANIFPPATSDYGIWYTCWFWSGRWIRNFAVWMLVLFQMGILNGFTNKTK